MSNPWDQKTDLTVALDAAEQAASDARAAQQENSVRNDEQNGRDVAIAITNLETAVLWLRQAVAKQRSRYEEGMNE